MKNKSLQAELDWVDAHPEYYRGPQHMIDVKHNISVNYVIRKLQGDIHQAISDNDKVKEIGSRIVKLRATLRGIKVGYTSIKVPVIPKTSTEMAEVAKQNV